MIGKITSEKISRRRALSLLGALGFVAAPTVRSPSNAEAQTAGAGATQSCFGITGRRIARRLYVGRA